MIKISIDMIPKGIREHKRSLGVIEINLEAVDPSFLIGRYTYVLRKWTKNKGIWKQGEVEGHHRKRRGPYDLLYRVLADAVGSRNPDVRPLTTP